MITGLQNIKWLNIFWGFLALFMLNISIDVADDATFNNTEDLSFNEQESMIEYVLEEMMGIEDAIPESEDNDASQNVTLKKGAGFDIYILVTPLVKHQLHLPFTQNKYALYPDTFYAAGHSTIISPPPEV